MRTKVQVKAPETALVIPETEPMESVATLSAEGARNRIAEAIETIAQAASSDDLMRAVATLEHADRHVGQLQEASALMAQATQALHQVALKLQEQRNEAVGERDEARQFARRAWDEGLNHIFECGDCYMSMQEYILDAFTEEFDDGDLDWCVKQLREWGENDLADEYEAAAKAVGASITHYNELLGKVMDIREAHEDRPKPHVEPAAVVGVEPMDEAEADDIQMSDTLEDWDDDCEDPEFDEEGEGDDDSDTDEGADDADG